MTFTDIEDLEELDKALFAVFEAGWEAGFDYATWTGPSSGPCRTLRQAWQYHRDQFLDPDIRETKQ